MSGGMDAVVTRKNTFNVNGKTYLLSALSLADWVMAEQEALKQYRRGYIATYAENLDALPEAIRDKKLEEAFERASLMTSDDLPKKSVDMPVVAKDGSYVKKDGKPVMIAKAVPYQAYWMSNSPAGQVYSLWLSLRKEQKDITLEQVDEIFQDPKALEQAAQILGDLSTPKVGNE